MAALSAADDVRLRTWSVEIAATLLPPGSLRQDRGSDWRFSKTSGLSVAKRSGAWFHHTDGVGSYSTIRLIERLRSCDRAEAEQWAVAWLASHPGTGSCDGTDDAEDSQAASQVNALRAKAITNAVIPAEGTVAETYLRARGIEPPYPDCVRFLSDGRIGEGALVGLLLAHDVVIGAQLTFLDPQGRKSLREPARQTFVLDRDRAKGAVFPVEKLSSNARMLLCEGLEDGLSLRACGRPEAIFAFPGIGGLRHFAARRGQGISFVRDGDEPGSAADVALIEGLDHALLQHAEVRVTRTPLGKDANDILREFGADALNVLVDAAVAVELSEAGEIKRLAQITDPVDYDRERRRIADKFGIRRTTVDKKVETEKPSPKKKKRTVEADGSGLVEREPQPWHDLVALGDVLTALRDRLNAHVVFRSPAQATVVAVWIAHTYVFAGFEFTPRLAIESATPRCGKTTLHDLLALTCYRPVEADKLTPASLVRMKSAVGPITTLLDEMGDLLRASPELDAVLRSGFQRGKRYVNLRPLPDGTFEHESHDVFGPVALAMVGATRNALADRCIHLHLQRKPVARRVAKLRHGKGRNRQILLGIGRQLARWAADDGDALGDEPDIPEELNDRQADFAIPLLAIADQAGGTWSHEVRTALVQLLAEGADRAADDTILLLRDLHRIFDEDLQAQVAAKLNGLTPSEQQLAELRQQLAKDQEIGSGLLVERLVRLAESPWPQMANGRPLSQWTLATLLRNFDIRPMWIGQENARKRGYLRLQFSQAWEVYLRAQNRVFSQAPPNPTAQAVQADEITENFNALRLDSENFQTVQLPDTAQSAKSAGPANPAGLAQSAQSAQSESGVLGEKHRQAPETPSEATEPHNRSGRNFSFRSATGNYFAPCDVGSLTPHGAVPGTAGDNGTQPTAGFGNGAASGKPASVATLIRLIAATHPDWTEVRLAKASGQPISIVRRALARKARPDHTPTGVH